ncbi:MAG TPA: hypothetical protein P5137_00450, partial [Candidatus Brocadiia bacterium]|nr:hypothetical protein [Candidatus Brocadiia bacterium]
MGPGYLDMVKSHLDAILADGSARLGPSPCDMWMSSLDTRTGRYPEDDRRPPEIPRRHYRAIDAPKGCSLYWDQPSLLAAEALTAATGAPRYAEAAEAYVRDFLARCVARNGVFLWGNHYYWDAFDGVIKRFAGEETPRPIDPETEDGSLHETRPTPPAWDLLWRVSPEMTAREIRVSGANSIFDEFTGGFNRHADRKKGCAFLESGGILMESLAWLGARTGDASLIEMADKVARFSFGFRNAATGLVENNPTQDRWDKRACTTEIGLWGGCLVRAAETAGRFWWIEMAAEAVGAFLRWGYDEAAGRYFGKVRLSDGGPVRGVESGPADSATSEKHQPGEYSDPWRPLFPAHDYP